MKESQSIWSLIQKIRSTNPIIHNITNYVVMNQTANALLALGASPIMAHAPQELSEIIAQSNALVVNIGTLDSRWISSIKIACCAAKQAKIPVILDPVGSGFTKLRTNIARELLENNYIDIVRCNASEAASLVDEKTSTHGVESSIVSTDIAELGKKIASAYNIVLCVTSEKDLIINSKQIQIINNGHKIMSKVTGMGCIASSIVGAFAVCTDDHSLASLAAMAVMGICGEKAAARCQGPGSFHAHFLDELYQLDEQTINTHLKLQEYA